MPIYEYRCASCGHQQEFLQKVSATPLTTCTKCGKESFSKMLTAAGFQLKGSGWYATDFKGGAASTPATKPADSTAAESKGDSGAAKPDAATATAKGEAATTKPAAGASSARESTGSSTSTGTSGPGSA